jgi:hypothetical protein
MIESASARRGYCVLLLISILLLILFPILIFVVIPLCFRIAAGHRHLSIKDWKEERRTLASDGTIGRLRIASRDASQTVSHRANTIWRARQTVSAKTTVAVACQLEADNCKGLLGNY